MAGIGPFPSFSFPGVYTQTLNEAPGVTAAGALRVPAFIGVADEVIPVTAYEMIRGSSSIADNFITKEEITSSGTYPINGSNRTFRVTFYPIVSGQGNGTTTDDITKVIVYVNGDSVPVASVDGVNGLVSTVTAPSTGDLVEISYYYKKTDTLISEENLSLQADGSNTTFKVENLPIVDGSNGGIITTDTSKVTVTVNSVAVTVSEVNGADGIITLAAAPSLGALVEVTYYTNEYQDTYDILPSHNVDSITKVGLSPSTLDFVNGTDYVLDTTGNFNTINWGNSAIVSSGTYTSGYTQFLDQVSATLVDNRIYVRPVAGTIDGTNKTFTLPDVPTNGSGLGKATDSTAGSLIMAYVGNSPADKTQATILEISSAGQTMTLSTAPASGKKVYVTQYQNILTDNAWTLTNLKAGLTDGTYTVVGSNSGSAMSVNYTTSSVTNPNFGTEGVRYPAGASTNNDQYSDAQVIPGYGVAETVTLTFIQLGSDLASDVNGYIVTSTNPLGTGSLGDNTGYIGQTYIDNKTGFRITVMHGSTYNYVATDFLSYTVGANFITPSNPTRAVPGLYMYVTDTAGVKVNDTAIVTTYNKSGNEPNIGDYYYVTFNATKQFNSDNYIDPVFVTTEKDALAYTGPLSVSNKLALAAHMAFLNGAPGVILLQIQKTTGGTDAPDSRYITGIDVFNSPMEGGIRPALIEPVTTSTGVLSYTKTSNIIQSSIRNANERMTYFGFALGTTPTQAMSYAQGLYSERMTGIYPDGAVVALTDELGNTTEFLVDGSILAAAMSGLDTKTAYDVAEPLTRKPIVGFTRLYRRLDTVTQSQVASSGLTLLTESASGISIKIDLTTDVTSPLTRIPSVIKIKDFVQKGIRDALDPYIGSKYLPTKTVEIVSTVKSYLSSLVKAQIITAFTGVSAVPDPVDPTTIQVTASYSPVFPLLYIVVTFNLRTRI